jgi:hypothetical protein
MIINVKGFHSNRDETVGRVGCAAELGVRDPVADSSDDLSHKSKRCDQLASSILTEEVVAGESWPLLPDCISIP